MNSHLVESVLIHTFGRQAHAPRQTAWRRLLFAFLLATALDVVITQTLITLRLPADLFQSWLTIMLILATQITIGLIMLIVRASGYGLHDDQINDLLGILPVSETTRWIVGLLPGLCLVLMLFVLAIGPLIVISGILQLNWFLFSTGLIVGIISGIGLGTYQPNSSIALNFLLMAALVAVELQLLDRIMTLYQIHQDPFLIGFAALLSFICIPFYWVVRSIQTWSQARQRKITSVIALRIVPISLQTWMSVKIMRHPKVLRSTVVLFGISGFLAYLWLQAGGGQDPHIGTIIIGLSFIASLAASDVRSLTRPQAAPEMFMIRGSHYFVLQQVAVGFIVSLVATLPLWASIIATHSHNSAVYTAVIGQIALGTSVAILASTLFVPSQQDISAEFLGATLSTCTIIALEKLTSSLNIATSLKSESLIWLSIAVVLVGFIFSVERRRNNYYWKETHHYVS